MRKLTWWMRLVGAFQLLQAFGNFYALYLMYTGPESMASFMRPGLQGISDAALVSQYADVWLIFMLDLVVLGAALLFAARDPSRHLILAYTVIGFELIHGLIGDVIWIVLGYPAARIGVGIAIHLVVALSGLIFARGFDVESEQLMA
jgi:hypothetical protein